MGKIVLVCQWRRAKICAGEGLQDIARVTQINTNKYSISLCSVAEMRQTDFGQHHCSMRFWWFILGLTIFILFIF